MNFITFNKPYLTGKETLYIQDAVKTGKISGNGKYTELCQTFFQKKYNFRKCLLTTSCTDALEMAAILLNIQEGDEIIAPSFTFVSTVNAFILRGAKIIFADSRTDHPGIDEDRLEQLITPNTKAIVVVHYAGVACNMDKIMAIAEKHHLYVVEDAAQAIDAYYTNKHGNNVPLGSIGHLATFSFHETKNIISGEGGMLVINQESFIQRAEIIWEKGTNRSAFFRGEVDKYNWVDIGSSFLPSDMIAAFLWAQLENLDDIQNKRKQLWNNYFDGFKELQLNDKVGLPSIPDYSSNNAHMFYLVCEDEEQRNALILHLKENNIYAVFHYLSLHKSPYYKINYEGAQLNNSDHYSNCLVRLPFFYELTEKEQNHIINGVTKFYSE